MPPTLRRRVLPLAAVPLVLLLVPPAAAQQDGPDRGCRLTLQPTDSTRSLSRRVGEEDYVTYLWNGMRWLCGAATMTADSAVQYAGQREVLMVGSVHYRDTIRDLRSRTLTYYRGDNRVLAEDSVRLRQLETGALLRGPRVEFYNAVRGSGPQRTVATRRPRVRIPPPEDADGGPLRVVADTVVLVGEEATETFGDVRVRRDAMTARGGYGRFRIDDGTGYLARTPVLNGEEFTLTGDTIRVGFEGTDLRSVRAVGNGRLTAEDVEVSAARVDVRVEAERAEEMWAYGEGTSRAVSAEQEVRGDSLHFDLAGGRLSAITAVGDALAMQLRPGPPASSDSDSLGAAGADSVDADSAASGGGRDAPRPALGLDRSWIAGDTVRATFGASDSASDSVPAGRDTAAGAGADTSRAGGQAERRRLRRLVAAGDARSFYRIPGDTADAEGQADGGDSAAASADEAESRAARNYVIGTRITIDFRDGAPHSVQGTRAIGVFLEPVAVPDSVAGDTAAADTAGAGGAARDTAPSDGRPDSLAAAGPPADSVPADTSAPRPPPPDSTPGERAALADRPPRGRLSRTALRRHTLLDGRYNRVRWHGL